MRNLDNLITAPCVPVTECNVEDPTIELVLKPAVVILCRDKSVQMHTFIRTGTIETEITTGLIYSSSNQSIAVIGALGGNVSGKAEGIATIEVEWMGKKAYSQVQVMPESDCCAKIYNQIAIIVDKSKSMGVEFGGVYPTKLDFAKTVARRFVNKIDLAKDSISLYTFDEAGQLVVGLQATKTELLFGITNISSTLKKTNVESGITNPIAALNSAVGLDSRKVLIIISDFENKLGGDPLVLAQKFQESGGVVIVVAVRAYGDGFVLGSKMATGGFFLNGYPAVEQNVLKAVDNVRTYFCSGVCVPDGGIFASRSQLNYSNLTRWNVPSYHVSGVGPHQMGVPDLIGVGSDGVALYDLIAGNGLYLDMVGSMTFPVDGSATIETKNSFTFDPGNSYKLTIRVAGNQRTKTSAGKLAVYLDGILDGEVIERTWNQNFTDETFNITVATQIISKLRLQYTNLGVWTVYGYLLDLVKIENVTTGAVMFIETWDDENLIYIEPACGQGTIPGYTGYGYNGCYDDCVIIAPDAQDVDPNRAPEVEDNPPPPYWTSTKSVTVACPAGTTGPSVTKSATRGSSESQAKADADALAAATAAATAALVCDTPIAEGKIISIALRPPTITVAGFAAIGTSSSDYWNVQGIDNLNLKYVDTTQSGMQLAYSASHLSYVNIPTHPLNLMRYYADGLDGTANNLPEAIDPVIGPLPIGEYEIYVYGHENNNSGYVNVEPQVGTYNPTSHAFTPATSYGNKYTSNGDGGWLSGTWTEGAQYVKFKVVNGTDGKYLRLRQISNDSGNFIMAGIQIRKTEFSPTGASTILITDNSLASKFPAVCYVEGEVGFITSITLNLEGFQHDHPGDIDMLLVSPSGTHVIIMSDAGAGNSINPGVSLKFQDDAAWPDIPESTQIVAGTYHTKDWNPLVGEFGYGRGSSPPGPHSANLTAFHGERPNGAWKLYVLDDTGGQDGQFDEFWLEFVLS